MSPISVSVPLLPPRNFSRIEFSKAEFLDYLRHAFKDKATQAGCVAKYSTALRNSSRSFAGQASISF